MNIALLSYMALFFIGILYGYGMMLGGFTQRKQMYKFYQLDDSWDPTLVVIYGYGLVAHFVITIFIKYIMYTFLLLF